MKSKMFKWIVLLVDALGLGFLFMPYVETAWTSEMYSGFNVVKEAIDEGDTQWIIEFVMAIIVPVILCLIGGLVIAIKASKATSVIAVILDVIALALYAMSYDDLRSHETGYWLNVGVAVVSIILAIVLFVLVSIEKKKEKQQMYAVTQ